MTQVLDIGSDCYLLGIDPGWRNLGYAVLKQEGQGFRLVKSGVNNPSEKDADFPDFFYSQVFRDIIAADDLDPDEFPAVGDVAIERYVPYNNTFSAEAENITMLIGGLRQIFNPVRLYRAIDWKTALVKLLVKHTGFDNPSTSLDKKFSIAAAKHILNNKGEFSSDHEADAICLAAFPVLAARHAKR